VAMALHREMADDERVVVLGEDVGASGGVFRATDGLPERFGADGPADGARAAVDQLIASVEADWSREGNPADLVPSH